MVRGAIAYSDNRLRRVLHYGPNTGNYGREKFRDFIFSLEEQIGVKPEFTTHEKILDIYSFFDGRIDVRHYSLEYGKALALITADKDKTSLTQRRELLGIISGTLVR